MRKVSFVGSTCVKNELNNMSVAFKEWAIVCEAIGSGRQSIMLRKGGIAEGRDGFAFKHREFFLFPTWFHEQLEKTTLPVGTTLPPQLFYFSFKMRCIMLSFRDGKKTHHRSDSRQ